MESAVFSGSFDPFTLGHLDLVTRALRVFSEVTVLVAHNPEKKGFLPFAERLEIVRLSVQGIPCVQVDSWEGLTVEYMKTHQIRNLLRGLRGPLDFTVEQSLEWANKRLYPDCETFYLRSSPQFENVSSTLVREFIRHGADLTGMVAAPAIPRLVRSC
jgi:pantetheine-phosphate adenylyltransferase